MTNQPNLDSGSNAKNRYGAFGPQAQIFGDFSAPQRQPQDLPSHRSATTAAFPDLEALYGNRHTTSVTQDFNNNDTASATSLCDWFGLPLGSGLKRYIDNFQALYPDLAGRAGRLAPSGSVEATPDAPPPKVASVEQQLVTTPQAQDITRRASSRCSTEQSTQAQPKEVQISARPPAPPQATPSPVSAASQASPATPTATPTKPLPRSARTIPDKSATRSRDDFRPKTSIPTQLPSEEYARQCIISAYASRLNPFALHSDEYRLLRDHLNHLQVTGYLNIRNGILRLWVKNPLVAVTREEAAGCAKDYRWFNCADFAYEWLVRNGYINFGCVEVPSRGAMPPQQRPTRAKTQPETIVIVGAGMAGLGCARQLEGLFRHFSHHWVDRGESLPRVILLEGRDRIGGRVYSRPFRDQVTDELPPGLQCTADLGASVITGFDYGNPLSAIIRGQLGLHYHSLTDNTILYDTDGSLVDKKRDQVIERLFNDIMERVGHFRNKRPLPQTANGDQRLIEIGRDPTGDRGRVISAVEDAAATISSNGGKVRSSENDAKAQLHTSTDNVAGKLGIGVPLAPKIFAALSARKMGLKLKSNINADTTINMEFAVKSSAHPSLGAFMHEAVRQYQKLVELSPRDLRLLNWHFANLEYANAANLNDLSLAGHDPDVDHEFEGQHAQIVGGYMQVPWAIWQFPTKLDVRTRKTVGLINYCPEGRHLVTVECEDGEVIEADKVVVTLPLGVLREWAVLFDPPLPEWKTGPMERLGYGTLNKVILVFDRCFWDPNRDMFGLLRDPLVPASLKQSDYSSLRGRFYIFWNGIKTSGRPTLVVVALMAGDAAHQAEACSDNELIVEAIQELRKIFGPEKVPVPAEVLISRWGRDRFSRGSYSYVGSQARPDDYDAMAKPIGNLHFAGEATCGTHPASVHGAYMSGLRAASEIIESMLGPIAVPTPFVPSRSQARFAQPAVAGGGGKRKADESTAQRLRALKEERLAVYEEELAQALRQQLGEKPTRPEKSGSNPFLLYQKDYWLICKQKCDDAHRQTSKNANAKATRHEVRAALGQMWREASEEEKRPYLEQTASIRQSASAMQAKADQWELDAEQFTRDYREKHPSQPGEAELALQAEIERETRQTRPQKRVNGDVGVADLKAS